jgi:hypothetical protein
MAEQAEDPTTEERADDPDDEISEHAPRPLSGHDVFCQKARDQSDNEPNKNEHIIDLSKLRNNAPRTDAGAGFLIVFLTVRRILPNSPILKPPAVTVRSLPRRTSTSKGLKGALAFAG